MKLNLIELDADFIRSDQIAAIKQEGGDEHFKSEIHVYLIARDDPIVFYYKTWEEAEAAKTNAVATWLASL